MSNFIYYEKLEDYEEQVKKAKLCDKKDKEIKRLKEEYVMLQNASDEVEEEKDREIERLNNIINKAIDILKNDITAYISKKPFDETIPRVIRILQGVDTLELIELNEELVEKDKEIKRLNNIINEFNEFIEEVYCHINLGDESEEFILIRNKWLELQELKGVKKND